MRRAGAVALAALLLAAWGEAAAQPDADEEVLEPRPFSPNRADTILLDEVVRADAPWLQFHVGGAIYDPRRDLFIARWSPQLAAGYRFTRWGFFGLIELDQTFDFTLDTDRLDVFDVGVGAELMGFIGHVRSSLAVGASVLLSSTPIDEPGTTGWFVDLRPAALRWGVGEDYVVEFTPVALDIVVPVVVGIPLVNFSYMTHLGFEWSLR